MDEINKLWETVDFILTHSRSDKDRDEFFLNIYPFLDINSKAKVLDKLQLRIGSFNFYLKSNDKKDILIKELENSVYEFLENNDLENCIDLLSIVLFYSSIDFEFDIDILLKCFEKISIIFDNYDLMDNEVFENIMINMTKIIAYASSTDEYDIIMENKYYSFYIELIYKFIDRIDNNRMINSELVNLLVETLSALNSAKIADKLKNKFEGEVNLEIYDKYVNDMIMLDLNIEKFFSNIKKYRIKYNIIPENICIYINKFYSHNNALMRICNIDLVRHYLYRNNIEEFNAFYDSSLDVRTRGLANFSFLALKDINLSLVYFHEATHVIQFSNIRNDCNYIGYNYLLLKDEILKRELGERTYDRNHNRFLFEIDADYCGECEYYRLLEQINGVVDKEKFKKIEEKKSRRIMVANQLNIDGYYYDKYEIFDDVLANKPELLIKYLVMQIEYKKNGTRKEIDEILKSLEEELESGKRSAQEIIAISDCILEFLIIKDIKQTLDIVESCYLNNRVINEIKEKIIHELEELLDSYSIDDSNIIKK